jgi:4-amino-4-deoxy-L-arabinose transferase-like glycosyltransferase
MQTYGYYPPLYDIVTTVFFQVFGASVISGRMVAVTFALLSIWITFEIANRMYGPKIGVISSILLGLMPGFFWVSRVAMLETTLVFFFSLTLLLFFWWARTDKNKALILSGLALGFGFLAKYQILVAGLVMIIAVLILFRGKLRIRRLKFMVIPLIALAIIIPWLVILYQINGLKTFGELTYVISAGGQDRTLYSVKFPTPIFYLIEMTWPFNDIPVHPISLPTFIFGLMGLGLWAYRRKAEDKFLLIWFIAVLGFFTLLPNRQWRYVVMVFPVLAISAASLILFGFNKAAKAWKTGQSTFNKKRLVKIATGLFVVLTISFVVYSGIDVYQMVARDQIHVPIEEATIYAAKHLSENQSIMVACAVNLFSQDMVRFYLAADTSKRNQVLQYPELAVDAFTPNFDLNDFIALCSSHNVKYVFLYAYGGDVPYFNTTWTAMDVYQELVNCARFIDVHWVPVGNSSHAIIIFSFA